MKLGFTISCEANTLLLGSGFKQWSGTGPEIAKRRLREDIQVLAGLDRALLASAEIVTNIIGAD